LSPVLPAPSSAREVKPAPSVLARWVGFCVRHAALVSLAGLLVAVGCVWLAQARLGITTDTSRLFSESLPWRQRGMELDRRFPQSQDLRWR